MNTNHLHEAPAAVATQMPRLQGEGVQTRVSTSHTLPVYGDVQMHVNAFTETLRMEMCVKMWKK